VMRHSFSGHDVRVLCNCGTRGMNLYKETRYCDAALSPVPRSSTLFIPSLTSDTNTSKLYAVIIVIVCLFHPMVPCPLRLCHAPLRPNPGHNASEHKCYGQNVPSKTQTHTNFPFRSSVRCMNRQGH